MQFKIGMRRSLPERPGEAGEEVSLCGVERHAEWAPGRAVGVAAAAQPVAQQARVPRTPVGLLHTPTSGQITFDKEIISKIHC